VTSYARLYWVNNQVVIATELVAETLDGEELGNACNIIGKVADRVGAELSAQFGGHVLFEDNEDTPKVSVVPTGHAGYL
jgi:hypothetical protein